MESDEEETPRKTKMHKFITNYGQQNHQRQMSTSPRHPNKMTPKNTKCIRKSIHSRTPKATQSVSYSMAAYNSLMETESPSFHSMSMEVGHTPPAKRYQKIKNPFEAALAEKLHLPLIASPSLFQRPNTPQLSSTQFEWTIDEVSSLKPANVEVHEAQFHDSPDPELEAKAQSAISSYFKEQQIVPSPIDCPLRNHRIILSEIDGNTPMSTRGRRIRECSSQTMLTLPPILPPDLEEALKPYFQPHLAGTDKEIERPSSSGSWLSSNSSNSKDTSLRRKLFDMHNIVVLENDQQQQHQLQQHKRSANGSGYSNSSPNSLNSLQYTAIIGKLSDSLDKSSFGSLSPISQSDSFSLNCMAESGQNCERITSFGNFLNQQDDEELLSPIQPPAKRKPIRENKKNQYITQQLTDNTKNDLTSLNENEENELFTPERSSSPLGILSHNNIAEFSTDSFNIKVSRLKVNSPKRKEVCTKSSFRTTINREMDVSASNDHEDMLENTMDMDDIQVSELSAHSSNCSSSQSDTPRSKRRSASRKNLSQSFSALEDEEDEEFECSQSIIIKEILAKKQFVATTTAAYSASSCSFAGQTKQTPMNTSPNKTMTFYRTDSGFNEMSQNSSLACEPPFRSDNNQETITEFKQEMMVHCSTPSRKNNLNFEV